MSRVTFEVVPNQSSAWVLRVPGDGVWEVLPSKEDAIRRARVLGAQYTEWQIRVLTMSGGVEAELSSGARARPG